jgi:hypothetical protein
MVVHLEAFLVRLSECFGALRAAIALKSIAVFSVFWCIYPAIGGKSLGNLC